ncbi:MAG: lysophospholipid acyltransferase family protein [Chitinophagaceae bacterium]|nr:lysophospholipid acyltransferase family protein [Chitinophagaceae bacterium]MCW5905732.1 lysophospholipid acyltransferase family protein [Chitinophagaceae bacterium]
MYYIIYPFFYSISLLPWRVLYAISDVLYIIAYYLIRYRREVVYSNLTIAFPEKSAKEKELIAKAFYHNLIDSLVETVKLLSVSRKEFDKHCIVNADAVNNLYASGKSVQILAGHFFNWEFLNLGMAANLAYPFIGVYMNITNKTVSRILVDMRKKFGTILIPASEFRTQFENFSKQQYSIGLIADQNPPVPERAAWLPFFGKMTAFHNGPEKGANRMNTAVAMLDIYKIKRGYYAIDLSILTTEPKALAEGTITKELIANIEKAIRKNPANYLWSHRRWKHKYEEEKYKHLVIH